MVSFSSIKQLWQDHGFEIVLGLSLAFIIIYGLYRKFSGGKGTWASTFYMPPSSGRRKSGGGGGGWGGGGGGEGEYESSPSKPPTESKGELECRRVLQYLFKKPFDKARPDFLRNPVTGGSFNLELDCFQADMRLAVEYSGRQHFEYTPYFHRNKDAFTNQKYRDHMKAQMCKENGINLIVIPYTVKLQDIKWTIEKELRRLGYDV